MLNVAAPVTLKNILVATDFSALWDVALPFVSAVARRHQANLTFLNVIPALILPEMATDPCIPLDEMQREESLAALKTMADRIEIPGAQKSTVVRVGNVLQAVTDLVSERHIDLVVVTTHGRSVLSNILIGSTAENILRHVPCPVLSIGPKADPSLDLEHIKCIVVPVDFSEASQSAVNFAVRLATEHRSRIVLFHAVDITMPTYQVDTSLHYANREISNIDTGDIPTERFVHVGKVNQEITEAATNVSATCMVVGRHKHGTISTHLPFTTLHSILHSAPCPVFTVA